MKVESYMAGKLSSGKITLMLFASSLFLFLAWVIVFLLDDSFLLPLKPFQALVFIYVVIAASAAFTFLFFYLARVFKKMSLNMKILFIVFVLIAVALNVAVAFF